MLFGINLKMRNKYINNINIEQADPNALTLKPTPAATVLLLRDGLDSIEVFMIKRAAASNFGNAWVFPGGKVDKGDHDNKLINLSKLSSNDAKFKLGVNENALEYWIASIRECFEESGVLLAYKKSGEIYSPKNENEINDLKILQNQINLKKLTFYDLLIKLELHLATDKLAYLSHWITPISEKKRYSTSFFLGQLPDKQKALHDGFEGVDSRWITPNEALNLYRSGDFSIILPTITSLEAISTYKSVNQLLDTPISAISYSP